MPSSSRRKAPIGVSRSALRVARSRIVSAVPARRLASVRLSGSVIGSVLRWLVRSGAGGARESRNDLRLLGTKGRAFRGATLVRRCAAL